jgi:hypothetical protein
VKEVIESTREAQRSEYDLSAQEAMADSAFWMMLSSVIGSAVGAFGVFYLALTLAETRLAVKAAEDAVKVSRAYLHVESIKFWVGDRTINPKAIAWVKNSGETPAKWFNVVSAANLYPIDYSYPSAIEINPETDRELMWNAIGGGDELSVLIQISHDVITKIRDAARNSNDHQIVISGVVQYETFFSEIFETEFMFVGRPLPTRKKVKVTDENIKLTEIEEKQRRAGSIIEFNTEEPHTLQRARRRLSSYKQIN